VGPRTNTNERTCNSDALYGTAKQRKAQATTKPIQDVKDTATASTASGHRYTSTLYHAHTLKMILEQLTTLQLRGPTPAEITYALG